MPARHTDAATATPSSGSTPRAYAPAWSPDLGFAIVDPEVEALAERAARSLVAAAGLTLADTKVAYADYVPVYAKIEGVDKFIGIPEELWRHRLDELDPLVAPGWQAAAKATLPKLARVYDERHRIEQQTAELFDEIDVLLTPMAAIPAFAAEGPMPTEVCGRPTHAGMSVPFAMLANITNLPAISVPAGITKGGLPVGLQIVADRFREDVCLRLARILEQAQPWPRFAPSAR